MTTTYDWWGGNNEPPPYLKTRKQLSELGLKPVNAVGLIETRSQDFRILDTEKTGLDNAEIVEIAIIDREGKPLINTLVKPRILIPDEVIKIHGITNEMVGGAPTLPEIWEKIKNAIAGRPLLIYNAEFDVKILNNCRKLYKLPKLGLKRELIDCVMEWYSQWCGEWSDYYRDYKWQPRSGGTSRLR